MIKRKIVLTAHAVERILSRDEESGVVKLTMQPEEVLSFLADDVFIKTTQYPQIGKRCNPRNTYWVFYSPSDNGYFVAIGWPNKFEGTHEIKTIIPANKKGKWMLRSANLSEAKEKACKKVEFTEMKFGNDSKTCEATNKNRTFKVSCMHTSNDYPRIQKLFSTPVSEFEGKIEELIASREFMQKCYDYAEVKGVERNNLISILVRQHLADIPVVIDVMGS